MKKRIAGIAMALAALLLMTACGAEARREIYRVYQGQSGDWTLEVRLWVEYHGWMLLPADLEPDASGTYTRTYWKLEYHGEKSTEELRIDRIKVGSDSLIRGWSYSMEHSDGLPLEFDREKYWMNDNGYTNGIEVDGSQACYAIVAGMDGSAIRIDAPLTKSKG